MRSSDQSSPLHALGRTRAWLEKARRSALAQRPTVRWGLAATALAVLVLLAYLAASPLTTMSNGLSSPPAVGSPGTT